MNRSRRYYLLPLLMALVLTSQSAWAALNFSGATPITCGMPVRGDTSGQGDDEAGYGSFIQTYTGPDVVYAFSITTTTDISISGTGDLGLFCFLLNRPQANAGVAGSPVALNPGLGLFSINYPQAPPGTYYIVIDGLLGSSGEYDLTLSCAALNCATAQPVSCGSRIFDSTQGSTNGAQSYPCLTGFANTMGGPDRIYSFTNSTTTDVIIEFTGVQLSGGTLFDSGAAMLLSSCNAQQCLASTRLAPLVGNFLTASSLAPGTYYIIVDSPANTTIQYNMEVKCVRIDCASATSIGCSDFGIVDTRSIRTSNTDFYSCTTLFNPDWLGGEAVYKVTVNTLTDLYISVDNVSVSGLGAQMGFFLLGSCSVNSCITSATFSAGGSGQLVAKDIAPGTYYLVVDTTNAAGGQAEFETFCCRSGEPCKVDIFEINSKNFPEIEVKARVTDLSGRFIQGLDETDFSLTEDGALQGIQVEEFECGTGVPLSISIVIDSSSSMSGTPIADARTSAVELVNILQPGDRACVITFDDVIRVRQSFTDNKTLLTSAINGITNLGPATYMFDGAWEGIQQVKNESNNRYVFIFSDGEPTGSQQHDDTDCINEAIANGVVIYSIGIGSAGSGGGLERMALQTGGSYTEAPSAADLAQIYQDLYRNLKRYYLIRYQTTNPVANATIRNVELCTVNACDTETYVAQPSCLLIGNYKNPVTPSTYRVDATTAVGQRFYNSGFVGTNVNSIEVEIFFENDKTGQVRVHLHRDGPGGTLGTRMASADDGAYTIECPGWYNFEFFNTAISFNAPSYYWLVVEHAGGDESKIRYNVTGPQDGAARRTNGTWSAVNPNEDIFYRIYCCPCTNINTPTPTPTPTRPGVTPTPTCARRFNLDLADTDLNPLPRTEGLPPTTRIRAKFRDNLFGFNRNSVELLVNSALIPVAQLSFSGTDFDLNVVYVPPTPFPTGDWVQFSWQIEDNCGNPLRKAKVYGLKFGDAGTPTPVTPGTNTPTPTPPTGTPGTPTPPSPTPTSTNTPEPGTPTNTPTPECVTVLAAGYLSTQVSAASGATVTMIAVGQATCGSAVSNAELYYQGVPTGAFLTSNGDGSFTWVFGIGAGDIQTGVDIPILLELVIRDAGGRESPSWPYLNVE